MAIKSMAVGEEAELHRQFARRQSERDPMKTSKSKSAPRRRRGRAAGDTRDPVSPGLRVLAAIEEATDLLRTDGLESPRLTVRTYKVPTPPRDYQPADIKRVRELIGASRAVLAGFLGVNDNTMRAWEQGKRPPQPIARRFLSEIEADPAYWRTRIIQESVETGPVGRNG